MAVKRGWIEKQNTMMTRNEQRVITATITLSFLYKILLFYKNEKKGTDAVQGPIGRHEFEDVNPAGESACNSIKAILRQALRNLEEFQVLIFGWILFRKNGR